MRVAMYYNNQDLRLEEIPRPEIEPGEILVKVIASGICGSDVMEWYRIKKAPLVLGHEITGEVIEVGEAVKNYKVGDRVFVAHHVPCNTCSYCLTGNHTVCETLHTTNYFPGGFAQFIRVPAINVDRGVFMLSKDISFAEGTFIEPLACVVRAQRMIQLKFSQSILILGAGVSGLLHLLLAVAQGARRLFISDINAYRLQVAGELGATAIIQAKEDIVKQLCQVNENRLADQVIVCTSSFLAFQQALQCVDRAGTVLCFAPTEPGVNLSIPVNDFWRKSIKIMHSYGSSPQDTLQAIELLRTKTISVKKLITHCFGLSEVGLGFKLVSEAKECIKVIIEPQRV